MLKIANKHSEVSCETNSELKLRAALQRRSLAMDLAGIASYDVIEPWVQFLFSQLLREQPGGFSKVTLQQLVDCDKQLFIMASHQTLGKFQSSPASGKPLDDTIKELKVSHEILQYLSPLPTVRHHDPPPLGPPRPSKVQNVNDDKDEKGKGKGKQSKINIPEGCTTHDAENKPLCFKYQTGKWTFKGPAGKRCAKGYHKCYKQGCYRLRPYFQCNHADWGNGGGCSVSSNSAPVARLKRPASSIDAVTVNSSTNPEVKPVQAISPVVSSPGLVQQLPAEEAPKLSQQEMKPLFVEVFSGNAGNASFSGAMIQAGFEVVSVDHEVDAPYAPVVSLDLATESGQKILMEITS